MEGQERLLEAEVVLVGAGTALEATTRYLAGVGVRRFRMLGADGVLPANGAAWLEALRGGTLIVRAGFDDDPMLRAAVNLGIPAVVMRSDSNGAEVVSLRHHGPCPHAALDLPTQRSATHPSDGALAVLAGTLAATEAAWRIARPSDQPRARHLRLTMTDDPIAQDIPWAPECFVCGAHSREVAPS